MIAEVRRVSRVLEDSRRLKELFEDVFSLRRDQRLQEWKEAGWLAGCQWVYESPIIHGRQHVSKRISRKIDLERRRLRPQ